MIKKLWSRHSLFLACHLGVPVLATLCRRLTGKQCFKSEPVAYGLFTFRVYMHCELAYLVGLLAQSIIQYNQYSVLIIQYSVCWYSVLSRLLDYTVLQKLWVNSRLGFNSKGTAQLSHGFTSPTVAEV